MEGEDRWDPKSWECRPIEELFSFDQPVTALWKSGERVFARLEDGTELDITSIAKGTKQ